MTTSDEEDNTYTPSVDEQKKLRIKRKAVQSGFLLRRVRARKGGAFLPKDQGGKKEKHVTTSKVHEAEKVQSVEVPKALEVQEQSVSEIEIQKKGGNDDYVEITGFRAATPPPPPPPPPQHQPIPEAPESSRQKNTFPNIFGELPHATGVHKDDLGLDDDFDVLNNAAIKALEKKVGELEKEKAKVEAERDVLKKQVEELKKVNEEIKNVMVNQAKKLKKLKDGVHDNSQLFELLSAENVEMCIKMKKLEEINEMLKGMTSDLHEASSNEMKAIKLEMEAMKANKVVKDEQLNMLHIVLESHMNIDVHAAFNNIEVKRAEDRKVERERRLAEEATQKKKSVIEEAQEVGGSSSQFNVEIVDAEADPKGFVLIGESSLSFDLDDIVCRVHVMQKKKEAKDVLLLKWKDKEKVEVEEDEEDKIDDDLYVYIDNYPEGVFYIWQTTCRLGIPHSANCQESSTSGKQHVDQVFLTQPTVIYLHARYEGELEVPRSRAEMLEKLGLDDGKFKFDIEDENPASPEKEYEFVYAQEIDKYNDVIVEDASDSSDEETYFQYSGVDETFPSLAEMFKDQNEDEIRRKIVEKISTEGVPRTIPRESLAEERKKWFRVMPKERNVIRPLQYFTHDKDISLGDILSWGYLEDLHVYAIRREQGVQYFDFLSDIKTLLWWDVDELVQIKNIKQYYYGLEVNQHDQHLWDYVKQQAKARYPNLKPQFPKQIVTILESGEKDVTLDIKPPRCLKNMPLGAMEQDFHEDFEGWLYNETTAEAVISLFDKSKGESRRICILDPMWLKSKWRDLEIDEILKKYKREQRFKAISEKAAKLGRFKLMRPPPMDQTPIGKEENKITKWDRKHDGDPVYRKRWIEEGRLLRRKMLEEKSQKEKTEGQRTKT
ncbi:hypothetical protein Hanom_Chr12g01136021 [Helianthus anomalus]